MEIRSSLLLLALLLLQLRPGRPDVAFDRRHERELAANPSDLQFHLRLTHATKFHPGELIPLTFEFSSTTPEKYVLSGKTQDRSGRLPTEQFVSESADVLDPFLDYVGSGVMGGIMGGHNPRSILTTEPHHLELALNQWCRFDKPGRYRLYSRTYRVSRAPQPGDSGEGRLYFAAVSNIIEIEITQPDPGWQAAKLREIETILERADPWSSDPKVLRAEGELVYLATRGAVQLSLNLVRRNGGYLNPLGLTGAADRAFVISELDRYIEDPNTSITQQTISLRTLFDFVASHPHPLPLRYEDLTPAEIKVFMEEAEKRQAAFAQMLRKRAAAMVSLPLRKSDAVRKECANAIAEYAPEEARAAKIVEPDDFGMTQEKLIAGFEKLEEAKQSELLASKWDLVSGKEMIPVLRKIVEQAKPSAIPSSATGLALWHGPLVLGEMALDRLLQLAPDDARKILLDDLAQPAPRFASLAAHRLPAQDVPTANVAFTQALKQDPGGAMPLIARFGTMALANAVRTAYASHNWSCDEESSFAAYFIRVRPTEGKQIFQHIMANREQRGCFRFLLISVAHAVWNPALEELAIATLDDADSQTATWAAHILADRGGAQVEAALWRKLEQWSGKWRGRARERNYSSKTDDNPERRDIGFGPALVDALRTAKAWYFDDKRQDRLSSMRIEEWISGPKQTPGEVGIDVSNGSPIYDETYLVAQYRLSTMADLKAKLAQFPAGTNFRWCPRPFNQSDSFTPLERQEMYIDLIRFLGSHQMRIQPYSKEACGH